MILRGGVKALDLEDLNQRRAYYESLRYWLSAERSSWDGVYQDLNDFFLPRAGLPIPESQTNQGDRRDGNIINETATYSLRTANAGLFSGMSSPSQTWFNVEMDEDRLQRLGEVQDYLGLVEDSVRKTFLRSNFYQTLHNHYRDQLQFGTGAFQIFADQETGIRCFPWPCMSYFLAGDERLRIDMAIRTLRKTARQIVDEFGKDNVSSAVKAQYDSNAGGQKEQWFTIVNVLHRNRYFADQRRNDRMPWLSVYYELAGTDKDAGILSMQGFNENPLIVGRWNTVGENIYGESPCMDVLGTVMSLQHLETRTLQAVDKVVNPPMVGHPSLMGQKASILPGDVTFADMKDGSPGFKPAFQVQYDLNHANAFLSRFEQRIQRALFVDLFLMLSSSDRRQVTAEEIRAKQEEKMQVLGPVLERLNDEVLAPSIERTIAILRRSGKLPPPPQVMRGKSFNIKFVSILARAQRLQNIANLDRFLGAVGNEVAVDQGVLDNVDLDETVHEYATLLGIPNRLLRDPKVVAKIRADKQRQQQQAQNADNAQKLAQAANSLAGADTTGKNALTDLAPHMAALAGP